MPPSTGRGSDDMLARRLGLLRPPLASRSQIWSWYVAARTDVESANTELARIEAEFAKFVAAHDETDTVLKMLQHGPSN